MNFNNQIPEWENAGTEPSTALKNNGFQAGQKPPAAIFNWFWSLVSKAITELQGYVGRREVAGNTVKPTPDTSVTAETGAEISNDYRARVYNESGVATMGNVASGRYSKAEGGATTAKGSFSHAEGYGTIAGGHASHSEGGETKATNYYAHAEGYQTEATASFTHAEGYRSVASEAKSHAEGNETKASGDTSHAEGNVTEASGNYSHSEGSNTKATARCTHAEGYLTEASRDYAHAEGNECISSGYAAHTEGSKTEATAYYAHAEGGCTTVIGNYAHIEGYSLKKAKEVIPDLSSETTNDAIIAAWKSDKFALAKGGHSHCEGGNSLALNSYTHAEGKETIASGNNSHAEGKKTISSGQNSHAEGNQTTASGGSSHAEGESTTASGGSSHAEGESTTASANYSHAEGKGSVASAESAHAQNMNCEANGDYSDAGGLGTIVNAVGGFGRGLINTVDGVYTNALGTGLVSSGISQTVLGQYNVANEDAFLLVGCGTDEETRANALRVSTEGRCYGSAAFLASGADYAEMFEWNDGNPDNEDRRGLFVTLDGEKIRLAKSNDYILGIVSATPSVVGDTRSEEWHGKFKKDIFGADIWETVEVEEKTIEIDGNTIVVPAHTEKRRVLNADYDPTKEYTSRDERKEWAAVGLKGKLTVIDDGTCEVNGFCTVGENGIATKAESKTTYRVMSRIDDTHIRIFIQ